MTEYIVDGDCLIPRLEGLTLQIHFKTNGEIVRCRDCKHATEPVDSAGLAIKEMEGWLDCLGKLTTGWDYYDDEPKYNLVEPDGFCKWGERK